MQQKVGDSSRLSSVWLSYGPRLSDSSEYFENTGGIRINRIHISLTVFEQSTSTEAVF